MAEYCDVSQTELSSFATSSDQNIVDDEMKSITNEIINVLQLNDDETKDQIVTDLLENGRQSLTKYKDDIIPEIYTTELSSTNGELIVLLKKYFQRQWEIQYGLSNEWFVLFLRKSENETNPDLYERVLSRTAEYGNKYMKHCPILSIVLQLLFEWIDDQCLDKTDLFNSLWITITNEGLRSITKYSNYINKKVMNEALDKSQSALFLALREYYRPKLSSLLKEHKILDKQNLYDLALDHVAELGWLIGIQAIQQKVTPKSYKTLSETVNSIQQQYQEAQKNYTLPDTQPEASVNKQQVQKSMTDTEITVYFKQTGERVDVPVSLVSTVNDIIKYVCDASVKREEIDYNNYYLALLNNQEMLENDKTLEETEILSIDNPNLQLCMKTVTPEQIIILAVQKSILDQDEQVLNPQTQTDDIQYRDTELINTQPLSSSDHITHLNNLISGDGKTKSLDGSGNASTANDSRTNLSNLRSELTTISSPAQHVSFDKSVQKEDLAHNYQQLQKKIHEISVGLTRDPILRRQIAEKFNEINIIVCGSPRVGKSTLINAICQQKLAKTSPGLNSCTNIVSCYYLKGNIKLGDETISYQYNFWDTPGFENWDQEAIRKNIQHIKEKPKSDIICMMYCASPGSFANLQQLDWLVQECMNQHIFCALICTNKWSGLKEQRDAVMKDFHRILEKYHAQTREENGVIYYGNMGLSTRVNSLDIQDEETGRVYEQCGINELIFGIMQSLDDNKVAQWCMVAFQNKSFWKNMSGFTAQAKSIWKRFVHKT